MVTLDQSVQSANKNTAAKKIVLDLRSFRQRAEYTFPLKLISVQTPISRKSVEYKPASNPDFAFVESLRNTDTLKYEYEASPHLAVVLGKQSISFPRAMEDALLNPHPHVMLYHHV